MVLLPLHHARTAEPATPIAFAKLSDFILSQ